MPRNTGITKIKKVLKKHWGYDSFLPLQQPAMDCVTRGRDSVVVLPTGGGKSLCFQAPAVAMPGTAVVVSPLISLMKDQVDALKECGVPAARLDSSLPPDERRVVVNRLREGALKLLYVSPERVLSDGFTGLLGSTDISFVAVDEAHCVSMWGHDFRPEYRMLGRLKEAYGKIAVHAYTATATEQVRADIARGLTLDDPEILVGSFDRPNLVYRCRRRAERLAQVREVLDRHRGSSGIVYCIRRKDVDSMCAKLTRAGYKALPYHAGMPDEDRKRNQEAFIEERADTIVATVAFGMGIDKPNVRYVIHAGTPKSLEHYQQESGRAGRDGLEAECCLFYSPGDERTWRLILGEMQPEAKEIALGKLGAMYDFCRGVACRHKAILNYFGQDTDTDNCGACDVCSGEVSYMDDSLPTARKILSCVARLRQRFGADYTAMVLVGSRERRIIENAHEGLSTHGLLAEFPKRVVRDWIEELAAQDCLRRTEDYGVLKLTPRGTRVMKGEAPARLRRPAERGKASRASPSRPESVGRQAPAVKKAAAGKDTSPAAGKEFDPGLFEHLRPLRSRIAREKNVPAYVVFSDASLREMAMHRPSTAEEFLQISGVGAYKGEHYGPQFLAAIREYVAEHPPEADESGPTASTAEDAEKAENGGIGGTT
ncbi:MAG: DNA helicase RecQ [Planctomycetota bacterium]|jgi:ATP-dependent DNA helicase RecQ